MSCRKIRFPTGDAARAFILSQSWKGKLKTPVRSYRCGKCKAWHVTSVPFYRRK